MYISLFLFNSFYDLSINVEDKVKNVTFATVWELCL